MECCCQLHTEPTWYPKDRRLDIIQFLWIPFYIGFNHHDHVDKMAKQACLKPEINLNECITNNAAKSLLICDTFKDQAE